MKNKSETPGNEPRLIHYKTESLTMVKPNIFENKLPWQSLMTKHMCNTMVIMQRSCNKVSLLENMRDGEAITGNQ